MSTPKADPKTTIVSVDGVDVTVTNPTKVYFPDAGYTKMDVVRYYLAVAPGALAAVRGRPLVLKRFVDGIGKPAFYQKRAPTVRPPWVETVVFSFPSGRTAQEIVPRNAATLIYLVNLGCLELHPYAVRADDLDHPDELRVDLDPVPGVQWDDVRRVAEICRNVLDEYGLGGGLPKTSGSRGLHIYARIAPRFTFGEVRQAALALAREVERRAPTLATSAWWKEERHGVFIDYNQNARDRTTAAAYSVRPTGDARVSTPITWDELETCDPAHFTLATVPARFARLGDLAGALEEHVGSLDGLLTLAARQLAEGMGEAPLPPHFAKAAGEPPRAPPSRQRRQTTPRRTRLPVITIARAERREDALAALETWKAAHSSVVAQLAPSEILIDTMRGRSATWTRVRINLQSVPQAERPAIDEALVVDYDPRAAYGDDTSAGAAVAGRSSRRTRTRS